MQISVVSPLGNTVEVKLDKMVNASNLYFALYGSFFNPIEYNVISEGKILNPFISLADQGISDNSSIQFIPSSQQKSNLAKTFDPIKELSFLKIPQTPENYLPPLLPNPKAQNKNKSLLIQKFTNYDKDQINQSSDPEYDFCQTDDDYDLEEEEEDIDDERFIYTQNCIKKIEEERSRLHELSLTKIESLPKCGILLQQIAKSMEQYDIQYDDDFPKIGFSVYEKPKKPAADPLPNFWEKDPDDELYSKYCHSFDQHQFSSIEEAGKAIRKGDPWDW